MEFYLINLHKAEENIKKIENLIVLAQISKNKNLMLITLEEIEKAVKNCINSILHYEHFLRKINLSNNAKDNFRIFEQKFSKRYLTKQELEYIKEILILTKEHKKSPTEFLRKEEVIIMTENQNTLKLSMQKLNNFLMLIKKLILNIKNKTKEKV